MKTMRLLGVGMLVVVSCPLAALATEPFPNTVIRQENGKWVCPHRFTGDDLVVIDREQRRHELSLYRLFPGKDYDIHVDETTAGPLWGEASLYYITELKGASYFTMHTWHGKRLLVNLDTATIENPDAYADALRETDKREIRSTLADVCRILTTTKGDSDEETKGKFDEEKLHGAMLLAAKYKMVDVRPNLEIIEERGRHGLSGGNEDRCFAQLALRRLGFAPKGYPLVIFEKDEKNDAIAPKERLRKTGELKLGLPSQEVYELLGPPDYLLNADHLLPDADNPEKDIPRWKRTLRGADAWRYDFGPEPDFSIIIIWNKEGKVGLIRKMIPGFWHGDELLSDKDPKPDFRADGSFYPSRFFSKTFLGKAEDFLETKPN